MRALVDHRMQYPTHHRTCHINGGYQAHYYKPSRSALPDPKNEAWWHYGWEVVECPHCYTPIPLTL